MKKCSKCKTTKPKADFYVRKKTGGPSSMCKKCNTQYVVERYIQLKKRAIKYLGGRCLDCKNIFPIVVYDFHHRDSEEKEFVWNSLRKKSWKKIVEEIDKCDLLCSNCHRIRHYIN